MNEPASAAIRRIFKIVAVLLSAAALIFGALLYRRAQSMTFAQIRDNALDIARITAELVDKEAFASLGVGDEDTAAYRKVLDALERVRDSADVEYVYTIRVGEAGAPVFVVDADPADTMKIGEAYIGAPPTAAAALVAGKPAADAKPYRDRWGTHISAYAPLLLDGRPVGAAVVDLSFDDVRREVRKVALLMLALYAATALVGVLLLGYVWRQLQKYEFSLRKAQERVQEHELVSARFFSPLTARSPTSPAAPDSLRARYAGTEALNYDEAIKLLGGEGPLERTLARFRDDIEGGAEEIGRLLKAGDYENYALRMQALKNAAREIGATRLAERAGRLEALGNRAGAA